jgi:uncharacterized glyoxalase superfamily protein PhnB
LGQITPLTLSPGPAETAGMSAAENTSPAPDAAQKPTPEGWPRISSAVFYDDAAAAIPFLCAAFQFHVRVKIEGENGRIEHSELTIGQGKDVGLIMVGQSGGRSTRPGGLPTKSPRSVGGTNTQMVCVFIDDADAHAAHAEKNGAVIVDPPTTTDHGPEYWADRSYRARDLEGHEWWFMQRVRG